MSMISINGVAIATPASFDVTIADISKAQRNSLGTMLIERIATKRTIAISYLYLTQVQCASILSSVSGTTFSLAYPDPQTGVNRTANFYCGDRSLGAVSFQGGVMCYKDVKFTLIEL